MLGGDQRNKASEELLKELSGAGTLRDLLHLVCAADQLLFLLLRVEALGLLNPKP